MTACLPACLSACMSVCQSVCLFFAAMAQVTSRYCSIRRSVAYLLPFNASQKLWQLCSWCSWPSRWPPPLIPKPTPNIHIQGDVFVSCISPDQEPCLLRRLLLIFCGCGFCQSGTTLTPTHTPGIHVQGALYVSCSSPNQEPGLFRRLLLFFFWL